MIRRPHPHEIKLLPQIENEADLRYRRVGLSQVVDMPPASLASLEAGRREGRLWVAVSALNRPIGFALMKFPGGTAWLDQLSVLQCWQGRGYGSALIARTAATARDLGHRTLHLSTYRDVPWNAPYYARRCFARRVAGSVSAAVRAREQPWPSALAEDGDETIARLMRPAQPPHLTSPPIGGEEHEIRTPLPR